MSQKPYYLDENEPITQNMVELAAYAHPRIRYLNAALEQYKSALKALDTALKQKKESAEDIALVLKQNPYDQHDIGAYIEEHYYAHFLTEKYEEDRQWLHFTISKSITTLNILTIHNLHASQREAVPDVIKKHIWHYLELFKKDASEKFELKLDPNQYDLSLTIDDIIDSLQEIIKQYSVQ